MGETQSRRKRTSTHEWVHEWHHEWAHEWTHECVHEIAHESAHDRTHEAWFPCFQPFEDSPRKLPRNVPRRCSRKGPRVDGRGSPVLFSPVLFVGQKRGVESKGGSRHDRNRRNRQNRHGCLLSTSWFSAVECKRQRGATVWRKRVIVAVGPLRRWLFLDFGWGFGPLITDRLSVQQVHAKSAYWAMSATELHNALYLSELKSRDFCDCDCHRGPHKLCDFGE